MIICVVGPTCVGKTKLSVELAKIYNGEIINADSTQVYKGMDIGTAKVTKEEKAGVAHHLFDIKDVLEDYSVYDYQKDARNKIEEIKVKSKIPILVGGTGYYLKAALYDYSFSEDTGDNDFSKLSNEEIYEKIMSFETGILVDKNNRKRNLRLLEKLESGTFSLQDFYPIYDDVLFIGLTTDRTFLYDRINQRLDNMIIDLIDEVKPFYLKGVRSKAIMNGIGYKELYPFFENQKSLRDCVEEIKKNTRNYAKRQYTWFNNQMDVNWFNTNYEDFNQTIMDVVTFIDTKNNQ